MPPEPPMVDLALARSMGLSDEEWSRAVDMLGRLPDYAELGVISVMWSEHCSYKSSRHHLKRLPTTGPQVVQGPGENAGAVDLGDGFCAVFKMESHNHPSFIEPYQGAATGVGGILRDVFTMGARPVASLNALRFGRPEHERTARLLRGVVAGIGGYGNCMGVPTVGGNLQFDPSYDGNILVNAFTVGVARSEGLFFGRATGIGNPVLYVGAPTGRDGIHGATMASAAFDEEAEQKLPTVQVGDPFREKLLLEACLEIFAADCLEGIQDMGAAGLTSSSVEMASRGGTGLELDLDCIPRRAKGLSPYEMLLSESQERMLMVAKAGREQEVLDICRKWDLPAVVVGRVTDSSRFVCRYTPHWDPLSGSDKQGASQVAVDLPVAMLTDAAPCYDRPQQSLQQRTQPAPKLPTACDWNQELIALLGSPNIGSRRWVWQQFDSIVGDGTMMGPGQADAAVVRLFCHQQEQMLSKYIALASDGNGRHVAIDPYRGAAMVVAECARNVVCSGAKPLGLTDCLNFGNPEKPETMWTFAQAIDGMAEACKALELPVVSGNVSLYNETDDQSILPTPMVAVVGQLAQAEHCLGMGFQQVGDVILCLGSPSRQALAGSEWAIRHCGSVEATRFLEQPKLELSLEKALQDVLLRLNAESLLRSAHDISEGGLAVALAECCLVQGLGADIDGLDASVTATQLVAEDPSRIVVSCSSQNMPTIRAQCEQAGVACHLLGRVSEQPSLRIQPWVDVALSSLREAHAQALASIVGDAP